MRITLVRHTSLDINPGICYGQSDVLPSKKFVEEALVVREKLSGLKFDSVFSSPLKRCTLLAQFCGYSGFFNENRLMEMNFGNWELQPWSNVTGENAEKWFKDYLNVRTPNGESLRDMSQRIESFYQEMKNSDKQSILCFTHSGPIRVFHHLVNKLPVNELFNIEVAYGEIFNFDVK